MLHMIPIMIMGDNDFGSYTGRMINTSTTMVDYNIIMIMIIMIMRVLVVMSYDNYNTDTH